MNTAPIVRSPESELCGHEWHNKVAHALNDGGAVQPAPVPERADDVYDKSCDVRREHDQVERDRVRREVRESDGDLEHQTGDKETPREGREVAQQEMSWASGSRTRHDLRDHRKERPRAPARGERWLPSAR